MTEEVKSKSGGLRQRFAAAVLGSVATLAGIAVDTLSTWRSDVERECRKLERRVERLELLLLGRPRGSGTKEPQ